MKCCREVARLAGPMLLGVMLSPWVLASERQVERSTANLGGEAGQYTDWDRIGIDGFQSLHTVITISKIDGKPKDQWSSIARINLDDDIGGEEDETLLSLLFEANRKTSEINASFQLGTGQPWNDLTGVFRLHQGIGVTVTRQSAAVLLLEIGDETVQLPVDFAVTQVKLLGSGVDVAFDPIVLTRE